MVGKLILVVFALLVAGCAKPDAPAEVSSQVYATLFDGGKQSAQIFGFDHAGGVVGYWLDVGDGGVADACFVPEERARDWIEQRSPVVGHSYTDVPTSGCSWATAAAAENVTLEKGAWALVVLGHDCPAKDCRYRVEPFGFHGQRTTSV